MRWRMRAVGLAVTKRGGELVSGHTWGRTMDSKSRLFERIERLYNVGLLGEARVIVAGCGSGGSQVALQLAMSGVRNFGLYDYETLGVENAIRHACGLRYVGWNKTEAVADLLKDRNPEVSTDLHNEDLMAVPNLENRVKGAAVVILATDNEPSRY